MIDVAFARRSKRLAAALLAAATLLAAGRSWATVPADLCIGNPCVVSGPHTLDPGTTLDFGAGTDLVFASDAVIGTSGSRARFIARSITMQAGSRINGDGASCTDFDLFATGGDVDMQGTAGGAARIESSGSCPGTANLQATGDVTVGFIHLHGNYGQYGFGGSVFAMAEGTVTTSSMIRTTADGIFGASGQITLEGRAGVFVNGPIDGASAYEGSHLAFTSLEGDVEIHGDVDTSGGLEAAFNTINAAGNVLFAGSFRGLSKAGYGGYCGSGSFTSVSAGQSVTLAGPMNLTSSGGRSDCNGGQFFAQAGGDFVQLPSGDFKAQGLGGSGSSGGSFSVSADGDVVLHDVDVGKGGSTDASTSGGSVQVLGLIRGTTSSRTTGSSSLRRAASWRRRPSRATGRRSCCPRDASSTTSSVLRTGELRFAFAPHDAATELRVAVAGEGGEERTLFSGAASRDGTTPVSAGLGADAGALVRLSFRASGRGAVRLVEPVVLGAPDVRLPDETAASDRATPPNVLLYVIDALRADHLGCYGYARPTSPHIDALAREGVLFSRAVAQAPWTRPSVATLLSGLPPRVHGARTLRHRLRDGVPLLPELLRDRGYATAAFVTNVNASGAVGLARGFETFAYLPERQDRPSLHVLSDELNRAAFAWLAERPARPFFLYLHASDPHAPYTPSPEYLARVSGGGDLAAPPRVEELRRALERAAASDGRAPDGALAERLDDLRAAYDAEIAFSDASFGALVAELRRLGLWDDTLVVLTSDHGEELGDHGSLEHGHTL